MHSAIPIGKWTRVSSDLVSVRNRSVLVAAATMDLSLLITAVKAVQRQVDVMDYLLKVLSQSPLLRSGDIEGSDHLVQSTPVPKEHGSFCGISTGKS